MTWDASQIKQPGWHHVEAAFIEGAREARANPGAGDAMFRRAADGYTKRVFEEVDPISEAALRTGSWPMEEQPDGTITPVDPDDMMACGSTCALCGVVEPSEHKADCPTGQAEIKLREVYGDMAARTLLRAMCDAKGYSCDCGIPDELWDRAQTTIDPALIKAAPELLAQLSEAFYSIGKSELIDIYGTEWWEATRAAIAKATGASQ